MKTITWLASCANCLLVGALAGTVFGASVVLLGEAKEANKLKKEEEENPVKYDYTAWKKKEKF